MRKIVLSILFAIVCADNESKPEDEIQAIPTSYQFSYSTGNDGPAQSFREEQRSHDGSVTGKYGYVDPNGKLRIVQYRAGANGYSASGDIGPDPEAIKQAQLFQQGDPSYQIQQDVWNKMRTGTWRNWGSSSWTQPQTSWNSVNPSWNAAPPTPAPVPQPQPPQPSPPTVESERQWDERSQNQWDNTNTNSWKNNQKSNSADWNTWNSEQQNWNKAKSSQSWTSKIQHQWQSAQKSYDNQNQNNVPSVQWPVAPQTNPNAGELTVPYPGAAKWSQPPKNDSPKGDWQNVPATDLASDQWSQPPNPSPPSTQWQQNNPSSAKWSSPPRADLESDQWSQPPNPSPPSAQWQQNSPPSAKWSSPPRADLATGQWPQAPGPNDNPLSGGAFTHFSIEHTPNNSPPQRYQYSY